MKSRKASRLKRRVECLIQNGTGYITVTCVNDNLYSVLVTIHGSNATEVLSEYFGNVKTVAETLVMLYDLDQIHPEYALVSFEKSRTLADELCGIEV